MVGRSYDAWLDASGGTGPYRWTMVRGALPLGLRWHWTGKIEGKPKNDGTFRLTVRVADADDNKSGEQELILAVSPKLRVEIDVSFQEDTTDPTRDEDFIAELHVEGGYQPYKWELQAEPSLAAKIALDEKTGRITWTDGAVALPRKRFTVKCTDQDGAGYSTSATFIIMARPSRRLWSRRGSNPTPRIAGLSVTVRPSWRGLFFHAGNYLIALGIVMPTVGAIWILFYAVATPGPFLKYLGIGLLTALAAFLIGGLGGFLFGIPKVVSSGQSSQTAGTRYTPSSNLAEVSAGSRSCCWVPDSSSSLTSVHPLVS